MKDKGKSIAPTSVDRKVISESEDKKTILVGLINYDLLGTPIPLHFTHNNARYRFVRHVPLPRELYGRFYSANEYHLLEDAVQQQAPALAQTHFHSAQSSPSRTPSPLCAHQTYVLPLNELRKIKINATINIY